MTTMKSKTGVTLACLAGMALLMALVSPQLLAAQELSRNERTVLKLCDGVIQLFKQYPDSIWPGYNLARRPLFVYVPGKWALLLNYPGHVDGFAEYPKDWPDLNCRALFHRGQYKDLVGQLSFDFQIDTATTVAIAFPEEDFDSLAHPELPLATQ
jgi:hypothetical protein